MSARRGFTLTEVLVSLMVFSIVSTAMVGALLMGTRLFREGEMHRAANDEAMSVLALFERDVEAAIPYAQYGSFYAKIHDPQRPDCAVAWSIANPDPIAAIRQPMVVVLWGKDREGALRRRVLPEFSALDLNGNGSVDDDDPRVLLDSANGGRLVTDRCRFFGVWLAGTATADADLRSVAIKPLPDSWWAELEPHQGASRPTEPQPDPSRAYATDACNQLMRYPSAIRCYLLMEGKGGMRKEGIVIADDGGSGLRVAGLQGIATVPGSVLVIDGSPPAAGDPLADYPPFEIVGYHGFGGGSLLVNTQAEDGPLGLDGTGRGAFRSLKLDHQPSSDPRHIVRVCRPFSLTKALPH